MDIITSLLAIILYLMIIVACMAIYFIPTIIAIKRKHEYKTIIFILNIFGGWTGILWVISLIWAIWMSEKSLIDPIVNNPTGTGTRTSGHALAEASNDFHETSVSGKTEINFNKIEMLERLQKLKDIGALSQVEFDLEKDKLLRG